MTRLQFFDVIKQKIKSFSTDDFFDVLIYFGAGFVSAFIIKHLIRYFLWFLIFAIITVWASQNFGIVSINYQYLQDFLTMSQDYTLHELFGHAISFIQAHIAESLAFIVGFYFSWEIL